MLAEEKAGSGAADLRQRVFDWIQSIAPALNESAWKPWLCVDGLGVVDAAISPLNLRVLQAARSADEEAAPPGLPKRLAAKADRFIRQPHLPEALQYKSRLALATARSRRPLPAAVVFAPAEPTHVLQQVPVAAALESLGIASQFVTSNPSVLERLRERGVGAVFSRKLGASALSGARRRGELAARALESAAAPVLPMFEGRDMTPVVRRALAEALPRVHEAVRAFDELSRQLSPAVVIPGNVVTIEGRVFGRLATARGVIVDSIVHGAVGGGEPQDSLYIGDRLFVFGESGRRELIRLGNDPRMLEVSGAPYLDARPRQIGRPHPTLRAQLGLAEDAPFMLLATSGPGHCTSPGHHDSLVEAVARVSARMPDITFIAKLHRKDHRAPYEAVRDHVPGARLEIFEYGDLPLQMFDWLQGCRAMLTTTSFAAHEALLMGVPVITMDFACEFAGVDFIDAGATLHVRTERELQDALATVTGSPDALRELAVRAERFVQDAFYAADGQSSARCARSIARQLERIDAAR